MKNDKVTIRKYLQKNSLPILLQALSVTALVLNLWLASKLAPLAQNIALNVQRIQALENNESSHVTRQEHEALEKRLDRIENKLDRLLER